MATVFTITVSHEDAAYARQAVAAAFEELERIESRLSRHLEGSDVFRINRLAPGESTRVHPDTFACLEIALLMQRQTAGAFDVTYASASPPPSRGPRLSLDRERLHIQSLVPGLRVDLGGIGKGFALDRLAGLLQDWDINSALLAASTSTLLARDAPPGAPGWEIRVGPDHDSRRLHLHHAAMSGSGTRVKGAHIIDPRTRKPARQHLGAWAGAPTAAVSDALSTAFMILDIAAIRDYCHRHPEVSAYLFLEAGEPLQTVSQT